MVCHEANLALRRYAGEKWRYRNLAFATWMKNAQTTGVNPRRPHKFGKWLGTSNGHTTQLSSTLFDVSPALCPTFYLLAEVATWLKSAAWRAGPVSSRMCMPVLARSTM